MQNRHHISLPCSALLRDPDVQWSDIPDLPKAAAALLESSFTRSTSKVLTCQSSSGADTTKLLVQLQDGMQVEAVVMHYDTTGGKGIRVRGGCYGFRDRTRQGLGDCFKP